MNLFNTQRYSHDDRLTLDGATIRLRVDARASRVSLRIDQAKREVVATAPTARRLPEAVAFARERAVWIAGQLVRLPDATALHPGQVIEVLGAPCRLEAGTGRARLYAATNDQPMRIVAKADDRFAAAVARLLKAEAKRIQETIDGLEARIKDISVVVDSGALNITKTHTGNFTQGSTGNTYTVLSNLFSGAWEETMETTVGIMHA